MHIRFSPQFRPDKLELEVAGKRIRVNGELFNFNGLNDGDSIEASNIPCEWLIETVECVDGEIHLTVLLPHGTNPSQAVAFPEPMIVGDGPVSIPTDSPPPEEPSEIVEEGETDVDA